eukprot:1744933-Prymnesium_polylepis.1
MYRRAQERAPAARERSGPKRQTYPIPNIGHVLAKLSMLRKSGCVRSVAISLRVHAAAILRQGVRS